LENVGYNRLASRLIFDASLAVGMLAFAASLWGIPGLMQLGIAIGIGLTSAIVTFVLLYTGNALFRHFAAEREAFAEEKTVYQPQYIHGKEFAERSLDQYTLSVNSLREDEQTIVSGFRPKPTPAFPKQWSVDLIETLEWQVFDNLCVAYWKIKGNSVVGRSKASLAGVDFYIAASSDKSIRLGIVQSRSAQSTAVSVVEMQNFVKRQQQHKLPIAVLMYAGKLSNVVNSFCEGNNVRLISAENIYRGISALPERKQQKLLNLLVRPDYMIPTCPNCKIKLVKRKRKDTGRIFWGCISYPECRFNMDYVAPY